MSIGGYRDKIDSMIWSYSRLTAFAQCKYQFYLKYIVADDSQYLAEGNYYAEVGSFVHSILEMVFKNELSVEDAGQYFADHFDDNVFYKTRGNLMDRRYEACANYFADLDLDWLCDCDILGVEKEIDISIEGYRFTGYIDLLIRDKTNGDIILLDHKSARNPVSAKTGKLLKSSEKSYESYKHQMYLYSMYVKREYGKYPTYIAWNHFADGGIVILPFDLAELNAAKDWLVSTIHAIEREEEFDCTQDYFYCHNLCDFRNSCEYNLMQVSES